MDTHTHCCAKDFHRSSSSSARKISLLAANIIFYLADVNAGSLVVLTFASPAAPTPDCSPSTAVAWLTHFLPHLLPNDCCTPFPNSGPAHLCDWLLSLLQCSVTSLGKCYSHTSLELWGWVLLPSPEEENEHWGKNIPLRAL